MIDNVLSLISELSRELDEEFLNISRKIETPCSLFLFEKYRERLKEYRTSDGTPDRQIYVENTTDLLKREMIVGNFLTRQGEILEKKRLTLLPLFRGRSLFGAIVFWKLEPVRKRLPQVDRLAFLIELLVRLSEGYEAARQLEISKKLTEVSEKCLDEEELVEKSIEIARELLRVNFLAIYRNVGDFFTHVKSCGAADYSCASELDSEKVKELLAEGVFLSSRNLKLTSVVFGEGKVKSFVVVPLYSNGELEGLFVAADRIENPMEFRIHKHLDENDLELLYDFSHRLSLSLSRLRLRKKLESELERLKMLQKENKEYIELQRLQLARLNALHKISQAMRRTFLRERIIKILLLGVVNEDGLNFDRAFFFERDREKLFLKPLYSLSRECISMSMRASFYGDLYQFLMEASMKELSCFKSLDPKNGISYSGNKVLERAVLRKKTIYVTPAILKIRMEELYQLKSLVGSEEFIIIPVSGQHGVEGILVVEKNSTASRVSSTYLEILELLADSAGLSLELAENYDRLLQITKSLEKEKELSNYYRAFLTNILQSLETAIIVFDRKLKLTEINRSAERLLGMPRDALIAKNIEQFSGIFDPLVPLIEEVARSGETLFLSGRKVPALGDVVLDIRILPLFEQATIAGVILSINDVTERYRLENELKKRERLSTLGEVSAKIAHEIRNPISVISGFVNRLKKSTSKEKIEKYSEIILDEMRRLERIVTEVLEYSRSGSGLVYEKISAYSLCNEVLKEYQTYAVDKGINLTLEGEKNASFYGDKNRIKQVIINLVQNAIEASKETETVRVVLKTTDEDVHIEVINRGKLIPPEILKRVFEPFFTTKSYGTGLGLSICKSIVEEHNGQIQAESDAEKGTVFRVILPSGGE